MARLRYTISLHFNGPSTKCQGEIMTEYIIIFAADVILKMYVDFWFDKCLEQPPC